MLFSLLDNVNVAIGALILFFLAALFSYNHPRQFSHQLEGVINLNNLGIAELLRLMVLQPFEFPFLFELL